MIALGQQGNRTQWDGILKRKVSWLDICGFNFIHIRFLIQAVYDTILKPANVQTWGKAETPQYLLYEKRWSLKNILRCCTKAFGDGCYCWRHNQVLRVIENVFNKCLWTSIYKPVSRRINFLRSATSEKTSLLLHRARLEGICWSGWVAEILWSYCPNTTSERHDSCFEYDEASDHVGVDGIVGGKHGKVPRKEAHSISRTCWAV